MRLRVLGCSGGIGGRHLRTTSMLLDRDVLIDAGTGVVDVPLEDLVAINHVFLTHSHLDHVTSIPFMVDTIGQLRHTPLTVWGLEATVQALKRHIFNWSIWPDFTQIPSVAQPFLQFRTLALGETVELDGRRITALPANHVVPAVGYHLDSGRSSLVFTGDTTTNDALWPIVNGIDNLKHLLIECAFCNRERELAVMSKHLCPSLLADELAKLRRSCEIFITHLKPGDIELTMEEIEEYTGRYRARMLQNDQVFDL